MTLLYVDRRFLDHSTGQHPECAERLRAIHEHLGKSSVRERVAGGTVRFASREQLALIHTQAYIDSVERLALSGGGRIDVDTVVSGKSFMAAELAAGTMIAAVDSVLGATENSVRTDDTENASDELGTHHRALCLVRPPGHHALPNRAMGFCLFNNLAIATRHAMTVHGLNRILIVDWDIHHCNGTQAVFYDCEHTYVFSAHRFPFFPGTGAADETGTGAGAGTIFNLAFNFGVTRDEYRERFQNVLETAAKKCQPELVLVSAGFDAHAADPIGSLGLENEDFEILTRWVVDVANQYCDGKLVSVLEGGYNPPVLAESVECHLKELMRGD